ncbi:MAG TPA: recombinase family protein [Rubrobacteraceae bacterium]|nr:recombinase family protein [Rubrobacteraceae bacterium]
MTRAAAYIRTDPEGGLPAQEEQRSAIEDYAAANRYVLVEIYSDSQAPGKLLYHKPGLKAAIDNIKEQEDWEILIVADPRCVSDDASALHELVHKFSLYNNRLESPLRSWDEFLSAMKSYRRALSRR